MEKDYEFLKAQYDKVTSDFNAYKEQVKITVTENAKYKETIETLKKDNEKTLSKLGLYEKMLLNEATTKEPVKVENTNKELDDLNESGILEDYLLNTDKEEK